MSEFAPMAPTPSVTVAQPTASDATTAGAIATSKGASQEDPKTMISSIGDLKAQAPELYKAIMQSLGMAICREMKKHQDHLKKAMREGRENS